MSFRCGPNNEVLVDDPSAPGNARVKEVLDAAGRVTLFLKKKDDTRAYPVVQRNGRRDFLARLLLGLARGDKRTVRYKNGDPLDCRMENLEIAAFKHVHAVRKSGEHACEAVFWSQKPGRRQAQHLAAVTRVAPDGTVWYRRRQCCYDMPEGPGAAEQAARLVESRKSPFS